MNNEMLLRTSKGEYTQGEAIYGAVYLHICSPTEANGIELSLKGVETCIYEYECNGKKIVKNEAFHVDIQEVELFSQPDCFQFGCYVFPFYFKLPPDASGSFQYKSTSKNVSWDVEISYKLHAQAKGADAIQISQTVVVYPVDAQNLQERLFGCAQDATVEVSRFALSNRIIHITVKLIDNYAEAGTNLQLRMVITNETKLNVTRFHVKLLRYFRLFLKDASLKENLLENMEMVEGLCHVAPESGPHTVFTIAGSSDSIIMGSAGLDRLQIPLRENVNNKSVDLAPSVSAKHSSNRYGLEVSLTFSNNHTEILALNIPGVLPKKNKEWYKWKPPEWANNAETKLSSSQFSVPRQLLRTEAFAGLPTFQVL